MKRRKLFEKGAEGILLACALLSVLAVALITVFLFARGLPLFAKVPLTEFLFSSRWEPTAEEPHFGILAFIAGSVAVTGLALLIALPTGLAVGIYLAELSGKRASRAIRSAVELLAGIPSVIYGLFGIAMVSAASRAVFGGSGYGLGSAAIVLAIMTLPTIVNVTEVSLRAVPRELKEGSLALGATHWQTIVRVQVPAARSGIIAGAVLGMGRAIGETMAVLMVGGNAPPHAQGARRHDQDPDHEYHHRHELREGTTLDEPLRDGHRPLRLHPRAQHNRPSGIEAQPGGNRRSGPWLGRVPPIGPTARG